MNTIGMHCSHECCNHSITTCLPRTAPSKVSLVQCMYVYMYMCSLRSEISGHSNTYGHCFSAAYHLPTSSTCPSSAGTTFRLTSCSCSCLSLQCMSTKVQDRTMLAILTWILTLTTMKSKTQAPICSNTPSQYAKKLSRVMIVFVFVQ